MECVDAPHFVISIWIQARIWIWCMDLHGHSTLHNIHMDTNMVWSMDLQARIWIQSMDLHPHFIISIWIQTWIWTQSMHLHGVWKHFTFHNIHIDMDMAPCSVYYHCYIFRYQNRPIQNRYHIIYHNSRILNIHTQYCQVMTLSR